jgi:glycosyltransferase involved in cell wall biosynthesis
MSKINSKTPLVSIVTACYNAEAFIYDLFKSIVRQDYTNWEIIIVDDFSTDNSIKAVKDVILEFGIEEKVRLIRQSKNRGYGYTLWNAIKHSRGQLVAIIDADDALYGDDVFSLIVQLHRNHDGVVMTYSNYMECDGQLDPQSIYKTRQLRDKEQYLNTKIRIGHLKVFKRSYYNATEGVNRKLKRTVDKDLVLKLEEVGKLLHIDRVMYMYRKHGNNLSLTDHMKSSTYQVGINRARKKIYEEAKIRRKRRKQSNVWLNSKKCKHLQKKWGSYERFAKNPNKDNKKEIINVLRKLCGKNKPSVLDVGCGAGHFMWAIKDRVGKLIGLDFSPEMLKLTRKQFEKSEIKPELIHATCWNTLLPDNHVDIVYQVDVAMHVGGSWLTIQEMLRVAKRYVVFTGPSFERKQIKTMDQKLGSGKRWAVSVPLLVKELEKLRVEGKILSYDFKKRIPSQIYKHRILIIEKATEVKSKVEKVVKVKVENKTKRIVTASKAIDILNELAKERENNEHILGY